MVLFVDLESDDDEPSLQACSARFIRQRTQLIEVKHENHGNSQEREREAGFAAILTCYPYAGTE